MNWDPAMSKSVTAFGAKTEFACTTLIVSCAMALFFLLLSWGLSGNDYFKDALFGDYALPFILLGIIASVVLKRVSSAKGTTNNEN